MTLDQLIQERNDYQTALDTRREKGLLDIHPDIGEPHLTHLKAYYEKTRILRHRSVAQWLKLIEAYKNPYFRNRIASIVWYDYVNANPIKDWSPFYPYIYQFCNFVTDREETSLALYELGYPAMEAWERGRAKEPFDRVEYRDIAS